MTGADLAAGRTPIAFLPHGLLVPERPFAAILVGWLTAFLPSIALAALVSLLLPTVDQPQIPIGGTPALAMVVVIAPLIETLIMGSVLLVLLLLMPATLAIAISAVGWGIAHSLIAPAWGLVIWWPFLVFSTLFVTWRKRSLPAAFAIPAATHALQNLIPALLLFGAAKA